MTMRALMRQTSELDALDAHIAAVTDPMVPMEDEGVATASVTPAKGVGVDGEDGRDGRRDDEKRAKKAFSIALEEEIEHMHGRECDAGDNVERGAVARGGGERRTRRRRERWRRDGRRRRGGGDEGEGANWPPSKGPLERIESYDGLSMRRREIGLDARNEHGDTALIVARRWKTAFARGDGEDFGRCRGEFTRGVEWLRRHTLGMSIRSRRCGGLHDERVQGARRDGSRGKHSRATDRRRFSSRPNMGR